MAPRPRAAQPFSIIVDVTQSADSHSFACEIFTLQKKASALRRYCPAPPVHMLHQDVRRARHRHRSHRRLLHRSRWGVLLPEREYYCSYPAIPARPASSQPCQPSRRSLHGEMSRRIVSLCPGPTRSSFIITGEAQGGSLQTVMMMGMGSLCPHRLELWSLRTPEPVVFVPVCRPVEVPERGS